VQHVSAEESFDDFYARSAEGVTGQLLAFTGDPAETSDIVQEAYVRAWTRWSRVSTLDDPVAWVRRVAYNLAKNHLRKRARLVVVDSPNLVAEDPSEGRRLQLSSAMATLSPEHRQALILHYLGGLSTIEVAEEMGVAVGTVKSWLSRGRTHLLAALEAAEAVSSDE
jgi:RNA polymerase sigma-70 factor (ECF subfamily)